MAKRAILADVHANQSALEAVLADVRRLGVAEIVYLGDIVGYGARPKECVAHARRFAWCVKGNHDAGLFSAEQEERFSPRAAEALAWTRKKLDDPKDPESPARMEFLRSLPEKMAEGDVLYVHGSPRMPLNEYVKPTLGKMHPDRMKIIFDMIAHVAFVSHTHVPGVFTDDLVFHPPAELGNEFEIGPGKVIINVGSVGQPRDGNERACYALFDGTTVTWRRIQYDVDVEASRIYAVPELDDSLGDRLYEGR
jgi:diadenosine tetraphosphatase ApaH/serine/threonine PP2A family protein phosphatase